MVVNAQLKIGDARFSLAEESPGDSPSPQTLGGSAVQIDLIVPNVDAVVAQAVAAGAIVKYPVEDHFYGWRQGRIVDPFGHVWIVGRQLEKLSPAEMQRRFDDYLKTQTHDE